MSKSRLHLALLLALSALPLANAVTPPQPFAGTIVSVQGDTVNLRGKDGQALVVRMTAGWTVSVNHAGAVNDIKSGDFVATTNVPVDADIGKATELRVLERGYRPEEGTHVVSATNANMMTHGTVKSAKATPTGVELEVTYPGGSRAIEVSSATPVVVSDALDHRVLKAGIAVSGVTRAGDDGVRRASRLQLSNK